MNLQEFVKGRVRVPFPLTADAYTISSHVFASDEAKQKSVYNFTNRYSPVKAWPEVCSDDRMVFFGLSQYIRTWLTTPITYDEVVEAAHFMESAHSFGGPLQFPKDLWMRVVNEFNGRLPIQIDALPEGSTFFPQEPVIQVTSLAEGFGELAAHIEAVMVGMVSIATARATLTRHWLNQLREWVAKDMNVDDPKVLDTAARWMIHDFGMRASSCAEESELLGLAHLLSFHGTDTFNAAYLAMQYGGNRPTGTSILALAHRNVQGHKRESEAFESLNQASQHSSTLAIASYVADCYNFDKALTKLVNIAKMKPWTTVVVRPDSGPYVQNVLDICNKAVDAKLSKINETGWYQATNLRFIQGDSMTPTKVEETFRAMQNDGLSATGWGIFGVGGYLRNNVTRDSLSSAYKLSAKGKDNTPVVKLSETRGKMSIPGPNAVIRYYEVDTHTKFPSVAFAKDYENSPNLAYKTYYDGTASKPFGESCYEPFASLQERCIGDFDRFTPVANMFKVLSDTIVKEQERVFNQYRG